jgi:hypothetical protein
LTHRIFRIFRLDLRRQYRGRDLLGLGDASATAAPIFTALNKVIRLNGYPGVLLPGTAITSAILLGKARRYPEDAQTRHS